MAIWLWVWPLIAVPTTRIITTPSGRGMNPIRRDTMSEWSEKAWNDKKILKLDYITIYYLNKAKRFPSTSSTFFKPCCWLQFSTTINILIDFRQFNAQIIYRSRKSRSNLHTTWSLCNIVLAIFTRFQFDKNNWDKNSARCLLKTKCLMKRNWSKEVNIHQSFCF